MSGFGVPDYSHVTGSIDWDLVPASCTILTNGRLCINGKLDTRTSSIIISKETGRIDEILVGVVSGVKDDRFIDLKNAIVAPGFLELQTNGMRGFHFTHFQDEKEYAAKIDEIAKYLPSQGVTGFWATIPTVESHEFQRVRSECCPRVTTRSDRTDLTLSCT